MNAHEHERADKLDRAAVEEEMPGGQQNGGQRCHVVQQEQRVT